MAAPWSRLAIATDRLGISFPWAFELGDASVGFKILHSYRLHGLTRGRRYRLRLTVARAYRSKLTARLRGARHVLLARSLPDIAGVKAGDAAPAVETPFTARHRSARMRVTATGSVKLQALELR